MDWIFWWIGITGTVAFLLFGIDKRNAKRRTRRIPETVLLGVALLGGSLGALLGMQVFRHKTRHLKFLIGIPVCLILNGITSYLLLQYL